MLKQVLFGKRHFHNSTETLCIKKKKTKKPWPFSGQEMLGCLKSVGNYNSLEWMDMFCSMNMEHENAHCCCLFITRSCRFAHTIYNAQQKNKNMNYLIKCWHVLRTYCTVLSTSELNNKTTSHPLPRNISPCLMLMPICKMNLKALLSLKLT